MSQLSSRSEVCSREGQPLGLPRPSADRTRPTHTLASLSRPTSSDFTLIRKPSQARPG